jgi:toxin ParE1/3/4
VKLIIQASAEDDMLRQYDWYEQQGLSAIADRFSAAVFAAINAAIKKPKAGAPNLVGNPALAGLRTWRVKGFDEFRIYYVIRGDVFMVVRVLHGSRDICAILETQVTDEPDAD